MNAQVIQQFGPATVFEPMELPIPVPAPHEIRVRVKATSVNPVDYKIRDGSLAGLSPAFPAVLHGDVAGIVDQVGSAVTGFQPGDQVYGCAGGLIGFTGALAQYMTGDARLFAIMPRSLSFREAAALPLVGITAFEGIERAMVRAGQQVLIYGGTGGVGHLALQLAKARGAHVTVTASTPQKARIALSLGADTVVDSRTQSVGEITERTGGNGFDMVFDTVGNENLSQAFAASRLNGKVVSVNSLINLDLTPLHLKGLDLQMVFMLIPLLNNVGREQHGRILRELAQLVDSGKVRPLVDDRRFTLDSVSDAHALAESGQALGKVIIEVAS